MKKSLLLLPILILSFVMNSAFATTSKKDVLNIEQQNKTFSEININGKLDVVINQGISNSILIDGDNASKERVDVSYEGNSINVNTKGISRVKNLVVYITTSDLNKLTVTSSAKVVFVDNIQFNNLRIEAKGSADITMRGQGKELSVLGKGAAKVHISAKVDNADITMRSASDGFFDIQSSNLAMNTWGDADVYVKGNVNKMNMVAMEQTELWGEGLNVKDADVTASGESFSIVNVRNNINTKVWDCASFGYSGVAKQHEMDIHGNGKVYVKRSL